jgi:hypothetical protein
MGGGSRFVLLRMLVCFGKGTGLSVFGDGDMEL